MTRMLRLSDILGNCRDKSINEITDLKILIDKDCKICFEDKEE